MTHEELVLERLEKILFAIDCIPAKVVVALTDYELQQVIEEKAIYDKIMGGKAPEEAP